MASTNGVGVGVGLQDTFFEDLIPKIKSPLIFFFILSQGVLELKY